MANKIIEKIQESLREFGLTSLAVDNSTSVFILTFMLFIFGVSGYQSMPKEAYPEITFPQIFVNTVYFGNSAADIENLITRPIEKEMASISEIKTITSSSLQDYSLIVAEFESDVDIEIAKQKIKDAVDKAKPDLPNDLTTDPEVLDVNFSELPIMTVNISGDYTNEALKNFAEYLEDEIEDLKMISEVELKGTVEREVEISVDIPKMEARQVSFGDIENAIKSENITMSGGELVNNDFRRTLRVVGEFENVKQMQDMIVKSENQNTIYLRDIADVTFGYKDRTSIARSGKLPVISLDVIKRSGENLLIAADEIKAIIEDAKANVLPKDIKVQIFNDLSIQTKLQVDNLVNSIISGVILVVLVLLFFLGIRNSLFVGMAIPLSMLMGIMIMNFMGFTMNMVVLFGLILALGMLVDNAIVVVENIYRYMQNGYSGLDAAKYGTGEVALPIIVSTATTLAAFIPLAFWPGLMGSFMGFLPKTLIIVLSSSLFIALVINPVLTSVFMKIDERAEDKDVRKRKRRNAVIGIVLMLIGAGIAHASDVQWARNMLVIVAIIAFLNVFLLRSASFFFQDRILPILENAYNSFIRFALKSFMPYALFAGMFGLLIFSLMLLGANMPKVTLFPIPDPIYVNAFVEMPMGTDINATDRIMKDLEIKTQEIIEPYGKIVESSLSQIGENTSDPNAGPAFGASPNKARLTVSFVPAEDRGDMSSAEVMKKLREGLKGYAGVQIVVDQDQAGPPVGKPVNIEIKGKEVNDLAILSDKVIQYLNKMEVPGVEELKKDVSIGKPELVINLDRDAARRYGLSTYAIADAIRTAVFGKEVSKFKQGEDEYPIQLRVDKKYRYNIDDLLNQKITFRNPANGQISQVPISAVASISYASTYDAIKRKDQERVITISSNVLDGYNPNEIVAELKEGLADYPFPPGYSFDFTGEQEQMAEEMAFLGSALLVAVFAILLIIVAQFNSIISPFIIILSILFSTIGVFLGYVFTNMEIVVVMTGVGIISLAGIVVNNAIVLIDYINLLVKRKRESLGYESMDQLDPTDVKEAIINGGGTRLRPVLLTAITTILGLVPLAIGFNFDFFGFVARLEPNFYIGGDNAVFWGTMAWTVIYGLVFATFLTLVVVPVMYWLAYKMKMRVKELFGIRKKVVDTPLDA